jgi:hypothetical protein
MFHCPEVVQVYPEKKPWCVQMAQTCHGCHMS